jgi:Uma2 family endonuclease
MSTLMESWPRRHRITVDEYHRMAEVGLLAPDARVELVEGEIIDMAPIGNRHMSVVDRLNRLFVFAAGEDAIVRVQGSVRLGRMSEPQPDLLILRPRADFYSSDSATGRDALLAIEVSDTSLRYDREIKVPLYARHGVPEAWVVDLQHDQLLVFSEPDNEQYRQQRVVERAQLMTLAAMPGLEVDLSALFQH